jgi:hypothetical protein
MVEQLGPLVQQGLEERPDLQVHKDYKVSKVFKEYLAQQAHKESKEKQEI